MTIILGAFAVFMIGKLLFELIWGQIVRYGCTPINREERLWTYWIVIAMQAALTIYACVLAYQSLFEL